MKGLLQLNINKTDRRTAFLLTLLVLALIVLTLTQDFLRSELKNSSFYFSESFMFSSFWWLFAPLLFSQYLAVSRKINKHLYFHLTIIILPVIVHLIAFPFLVWLISGIFYYHTFAFQQTFRYTLSEHLYLLAIIYSVPVLVFSFFHKKAILAAPVSGTQNERTSNFYLSNFLVTDGNKKMNINVQEILYFSANSPYINIHLDGKKHLYNATLRSISIQLNPEKFVRVHKSTIVNIEMVRSYTTRLNGDYDLTMKNNAQIRVSRNFAGNFKLQFKRTHHHTPN